MQARTEVGGKLATEDQLTFSLIENQLDNQIRKEK
jgi:hypothetical protein